MNQTYEQVSYIIYGKPQFGMVESYEDINLIREKFTSLQNINKDQVFDNLEQSLFFVIRTQGEDNVHRAMKYGVWTSSSRKNQKLSDSYKQVKKVNGDVYLFFTEINSLCFSGVAKLTSDFDEKAHFKYWLVENKWFGSFKIEWLYVKDIDFSEIEALKQNQTLEGSKEVLKPVHDLIDCTELLKENAKQMLEIFNSQKSDKSLFSDFKLLDQIESQCREQRTNNPKFDHKFQELVRVFEQIPFSFSVASYERRKLHRKQNQMYIQQFYYNPYTVQQYQQYPQNNYGYPPQQQYQQQLPQQQNQSNPSNQVPHQQNQQQYSNQPQQQHQQNYWQQNNGFYHQNQNQQPHYDDRKQQNYDNQYQQSQQKEDEDQSRNDPVQNRFSIKGKKQKNEKRFNKGGPAKYVPKQDYQQDPNFVHNQQEDSEGEQNPQQGQVK